MFNILKICSIKESIPKAFYAKYLAIKKHKSNYNIKTNIIKEHIGAISCGIIDSQENIDLDFDEDSNADVDANFVVGERGNIIEIQCTAEKSTFSQQQFLNMMELAVIGINKIIVLQKKTLDEAG